MSLLQPRTLPGVEQQHQPLRSSSCLYDHQHPTADPSPPIRACSHPFSFLGPLVFRDLQPAAGPEG